MLQLTAGLKACRLGMKPSLRKAALIVKLRLFPLFHRLALLLLLLYHS